jgi:hypothetical protein
MSAWYLRVLDIIQDYAPGRRFTSDTVRKDALLRSAGLPGHPNAWGRVFTRAKELGGIRKTGRYFPSDIPTSNGRMLAEWERI